MLMCPKDTKKEKDAIGAHQITSDSTLIDWVINYQVPRTMF